METSDNVVTEEYRYHSIEVHPCEKGHKVRIYIDNEPPPYSGTVKVAEYWTNVEHPIFAAQRYIDGLLASDDDNELSNTDTEDRQIVGVLSHDQVVSLVRPKNSEEFQIEVVNTRNLVCTPYYPGEKNKLTALGLAEEMIYSYDGVVIDKYTGRLEGRKLTWNP